MLSDDYRILHTINKEKKILKYFLDYSKDKRSIKKYKIYPELSTIFSCNTFDDVDGVDIRVFSVSSTIIK
jgi:hypothetical protein